MGRKEKIFIGICLALLFGGLLYFWTVAHPLYIYDTDDWTYITQTRMPFPSLKEWNPSKVLPETLMPMITRFGVWALSLSSLDLISTIAISHGFFLTTCVFIYLLLFTRRFCIKYKSSKYVFGWILLIITLAHFSVYIGTENEIRHMFYAINLTCVYNYTIPGLFNAGLILVFLINGNKIFLSDSHIKTGVVILLIYLAVFSNLFQSVILPAYIFSILTQNSILAKCKQRILKKNDLILWISIIFIWLVSLAFEFLGSRSSSIRGDIHLMDSIKAYFRNYTGTDRSYWVICVCIILCAAILWINDIYRRSRKSKEVLLSLIDTDLYIYVCSFFIVSLFLVLLCSIAGASYLNRASVFFSIYFFVMLIVMDCLGYLYTHFRAIEMLMPLSAYFLVILTVFSNVRYRSCNILSYEEQKVKAVDECILKQVTDGVRDGNKDVIVKVPVTTTGSEDNFPIAITYGGDRIEKSLKRLGIISDDISIHLEADDGINQQFGLH